MSLPDFPSLFEAALQRKKMAQKDAAKLLRRDPSSISMWLKGKTRPDADDAELVAELANLLGIAEAELRQLLGDEGVAAGPTSAPEEEIVAARGSLLFPDPKGIRRKLGQVYKYVPEKPLRRLDEATSDDMDLAVAMVAGRGRELTDVAIRHALTTLRLSTRDGAKLDALALRKQGEEDEAASRQGGLRSWAHQPGIRDRIRFLCDRLNRLHREGRGQASPRLADVVETLQSALGNSHGTLVKDLLAETVARRLARTVVERFEQNWEISSEYLINSSFGFSTGISGLDFLFDGGLLPSPHRGLILVLKGNYGRAKSTLALEMASSLANQGHFVYYACFEESPEQVQERLSYIGYHSERQYSRAKVVRFEGRSEQRRFLVSSTNYISPEVTGALRECARAAIGPKAGVLLFVDVPPPYHAFLDPSDELSSAIRLMKHAGGVLEGTETALVVDSLEAVSDDDHRRTFQTFYDAQRLPNHLTLLLRRDDTSVKDFLADIVIRLELRQLEDRGSERLISIEKCRTQNHRRGAHLFKVHEHEGVTVYPSIHSRLTVWSRQDAVMREGGTIPWRVQDLDLNSFLGGGFPKGQIGLLYGERGTLKVSLGLSFLAAEDNTDAEVVLFSFPEDEQRILQEIQSHPQLRGLLGKRGTVNRDRMSVFHPKPDCDSAEELFAWFRECLNTVPGTVVRVVVNGLGTHISLSPRLREEMTLVRGVLAMMRRKGLSTLFLESNPALANGFDWRDHCDLVLRSDRRGESDGKATITAERHSRGGIGEQQIRLVREAHGQGLRLTLQTAQAAAFRGNNPPLQQS